MSSASLTKAQVMLNFLVTSWSYYYHGHLNRYYESVDASIYTSPASNQKESNKKVLIFVHGKDEKPSWFLPLINNLRDLISSSYEFRFINLGSDRTTTIDEDTTTLRNELRAYSDCNIILIGQAEGGLTIMRYATTVEDPRIKGLITIQSPLMGTEPSSFPAAQYTSKDPIVKEITQKVTMLNLPIYHIVNMWDYSMIPLTAAMYPSTPAAHIYYCYWPYSSRGMNYNSGIAKILAGWINPFP